MNIKNKQKKVYYSIGFSIMAPFSLCLEQRLCLFKGISVAAHSWIYCTRVQVDGRWVGIRMFLWLYKKLRDTGYDIEQQK